MHVQYNCRAGVAQWSRSPKGAGTHCAAAPFQGYVNISCQRIFGTNWADRFTGTPHANV